MSFDQTQDGRAPGENGLPGQLLVDNRLEGIEGLRAGQKPPVDEEGRSRIDAELGSLTKIILDRGPETARIETFVELFAVETEVGRDPCQILVTEGALVLEEAVVILPETSLLVRTERGLCRRGRAAVIR